MKRLLLNIFLLLISAVILVAGPGLPRVSPEQEGFDARRLSTVDDLITQAIKKGTIPGAVLLVARNNHIVYHKAYGNRQVYPDTLPMTRETLFDLASLTKPIATATAVMVLVEQGKLRLLDPVSYYLPFFENGRDSLEIRLIHLLTHTSGLPPYVKPEKLIPLYGSPAPDSLLRYISRMPRHHAPGTFFKYSCLNFITLQKIVEKVSGESLDRFVQNRIFTPLGMGNTRYLPRLGATLPCAATEKQKDGSVLLCKVHDPLARVMMGGVSGNAGLFSNAEDLAVFAAMILSGGAWNQKRLFSPLTVKTWITPPRNLSAFGRALGWDVSSDYSSNQGDLLSEKAFGHTGYTGTSLVIDPVYRLTIILLTNRVHPFDQGSVTRLRSLVANRVASALVKP